MESPAFNYNDALEPSPDPHEVAQALPPSPESSERPTAPPFTLRLAEDEGEAFKRIMDTMALTHMIGMPKVMAQFKEARDVSFTHDEKRLLDRLASVENEQQQDMGLEMLDKLRFRWVSASPQNGVDRLIQDAYTYGGNAPEDQSYWIHVGDSVVEDIMRQPNRQTSGVLFVYDGSKLTPITQEDRDADRANPAGKNTYMHAQKPLPGLELKDALIGMIGFDSSSNSNQQSQYLPPSA